MPDDLKRNPADPGPDPEFVTLCPTGSTLVRRSHANDPRGTPFALFLTHVTGWLPFRAVELDGRGQAGRTGGEARINSGEYAHVSRLQRSAPERHWQGRPQWS